MTCGDKRLVEASSAFLKRFQLSMPFWIMILIRFFDTRLGLPPWGLITRYTEDYATMKCIRQTLGQAKKEQNKNKIALFTSMKESVFLSENELAQVDQEKAMKSFWKLDAFLAIYRMEHDLATSCVPFTELTDELETIIERFRKGSDRELLQCIDTLSRKCDRKIVQVLTSAILATFSLALLISGTEMTTFITNLVFAGLFVGLFVFIVTWLTMWHSFPPLLAKHYSEIEGCQPDSATK